MDSTGATCDTWRMRGLTRLLWMEQNRHPGDRQRLFAAVHETVQASQVLYPGSFVDVAPSFVSPSVTYVDTDQRAVRFFADTAGVDEIIAENRESVFDTTWRFLDADYESPLDVPQGGIDLLISLYTGFVSEHCTDYLAPGGFLLVNPSHGDVAMASIDPRYRLAAVVRCRSGCYTVDDANLDTYLVPKKSTDLTADFLHTTGRGVPYTKSPFAYLFQHLND